jgi:hypothetical protein
MGSATPKFVVHYLSRTNKIKFRMFARPMPPPGATTRAESKPIGFEPHIENLHLASETGREFGQAHFQLLRLMHRNVQPFRF